MVVVGGEVQLFNLNTSGKMRAVVLLGDASPLPVKSSECLMFPLSEADTVC